MDKNHIAINRKKTLERKQLYKRYGYDQDASRSFVLDKCLPLKRPVIEIGTGKGYMTILLAKNVDKVTTIDISSEEQALAQLNAAAEAVLDRIDFVVCDADWLLYSDRKFGTVVSVNTFHHFKEPFAVLSEMIRVCKNKLIIADFNQKGFDIVRRIHQDEGRTHEEQCGDFSIVGQYLKENGFSINKYEGHCQEIYVAERIK